MMVLTCYVMRHTLPVMQECVNKFMNTVTFYVYILECSDKTLYIDYTNNIEKDCTNITTPVTEQGTQEIGGR